MDRKIEYEELLRKTLKKIGCEKALTYEQLKKYDKRKLSIISKIPDYDLSLLSKYFYSVIARIIPIKKRSVILYENFDFKDCKIGMLNLIDIVEKGKSILPYLSKDIFDIDQSTKNDPMLYEWGIYHFHIPEELGAKYFVKRTNQLLFAIVADDYFIPLDILPHPKGCDTYQPWIDVNMISIIEKNYYELLKPLFIGSGRKPLSLIQRKVLRSKNGNTNIITNSGNEYRVPGYGLVGSGLPTSSIIKSDISMIFVKKLTENNNITQKLAFDRNYKLFLQ